MGDARSQGRGHKVNTVLRGLVCALWVSPLAADRPYSTRSYCNEHQTRTPLTLARDIFTRDPSAQTPHLRSGGAPPPPRSSLLFAFRCGQAVAAGPTFPSYASSPPSRLGTGAHPGTSIDRCPVSCGKKERKVPPRRSKERKKTADRAKLTDGSGMAEKVTESGPRSSPLFLLSWDRQSRGHTAEGDF